MPQIKDRYVSAFNKFRWRIPDFYNIGVDVCDRWAKGNGQLALICLDEKRGTHYLSFDSISRVTNQIANSFVADGLDRGDRVAILLPRVPEALLSHVAAFKAGFVSVCLPVLYSEKEIEKRLSVTRAKVVVTDSIGKSKVVASRDRLPHLVRIYVIDEDPGGADYRGLRSVFTTASESFIAAATRSNDPAIICFTSGSEGEPKGVLHAHRAFLGALPTFELVHDGFPRAGEVYWTPNDWAWLGGLFPVLAAWRYGMTVLVDGRTRFDAHSAFDLMAENGVGHAFLPPTALKLMRSVNRSYPSIRLKTLLSGGETLGSELLDWTQSVFGVMVHEAYAQTECVGIAGNNARLFPIRSGSLGRPIPGHDVRIVDEVGRELRRGEIGIIGVRRSDPAIFLGYWEDCPATEAKFSGEFLLTGDLASQDDEGYLWYKGRHDDMITTCGYRISPCDIETCIMEHPAVFMVGVGGVPNPICTQVVKAWIVLRPDFCPSETLARDIQRLVRLRLATHQQPREICFVQNLPLTANGKVSRRELLTLR